MDSTEARTQLKGTFPFRLGTTSFIVPDHILPNVRFLSQTVNDIELLILESDEIAELPSPAEVARFHEIAEANDLTFTVHLPLDIQLGSDDEQIRQQSLGKCLRVMERLQPVDPFAWILHLTDAPTEGNAGSTSRWLEQNRRSLDSLLPATASPRALCIETIEYDFELVNDLIEELDLGVCLDVGHLMLDGRDVRAHWNAWRDRIRVVHLHAVNAEGRDHADLSHMDNEMLNWLLKEMLTDANFPRVVTLEVFSESKLSASLKTLEEWKKRICQK